MNMTNEDTALLARIEALEALVEVLAVGPGILVAAAKKSQSAIETRIRAELAMRVDELDLAPHTQDEQILAFLAGVRVGLGEYRGAPSVTDRLWDAVIDFGLGAMDQGFDL